TRSKRDWSSDVCSSDLLIVVAIAVDAHLNADGLIVAFPPAISGMVASCGLIKVLNGVCVVYSVMPCGRRTVVYKIGMRLCIGTSCGVRRLMDGNEIHRIAAAGMVIIAGEVFFNGYLSAF